MSIVNENRTENKERTEVILFAIKGNVVKTLPCCAYQRYCSKELGFNHKGTVIFPCKYLIADGTD